MTKYNKKKSPADNFMTSKKGKELYDNEASKLIENRRRLSLWQKEWMKEHNSIRENNRGE